MSENAADFLETGYETKTPVGDTYLRRFVQNWIETIESYAKALGAGTIRTERFWAADTGGPATFTNTATLIRPAFGDPAELIDELESFFATHDRGVQRETYIFSPWPTPDLRKFGWSLGGHPPLHILPAGAQRTPTPAKMQIVPVADAPTLATFERVAIAGYPFYGFEKSPDGVLFDPKLLSNPKLRFWLAMEGDNPAGVAITAIDHGINHVALIVTLPEVRGRGYGAALTWEASLAEPSLPAMLLSSDLGRPVYERMGYLPLFRFTVWYRVRS
jgi:hypothetical protein